MVRDAVDTVFGHSRIAPEEELSSLTSPVRGNGTGYRRGPPVRVRVHSTEAFFLLRTC
jgi:hypothetical protein